MFEEQEVETQEEVLETEEIAEEELAEEVIEEVPEATEEVVEELVEEVPEEELIEEEPSEEASEDNKAMREFQSIVAFDYDNTPIVDIVNDLIVDSIQRGVSDIHFDPYETGIHIRIRIDGILHDYTDVPLAMKKNMITRVKIVANMNITESRLPQDGAIKGLIEDMNVDLRVSCLPTNMGEKIVIRILDYSMSSSGLESLGFTPENYAIIQKMIAIPNGIILVTGATGSGKSTTVYAMLQRLNTSDRNLITVEDPIEMNVEGINQVQVNSDIGMTFASALRSILRQDPDVIMIGEIRDTETARIAVRSAITGHLVLSTIHTNDSLNTIERLLDMDVERYLLGAAFSGIVSQKLARRLCPYCKHKRAASEYEKKIIKNAIKVDVEELYEAVGCDKCSGGYKGRIPLHEVLLINQEIKDAISSGLNKQQLRDLVFSENSTINTMLQDGLRKVVYGDTSVDEILRLIQLDDESLNSYSTLGLEESNVGNKDGSEEEDEKKPETGTKSEETSKEEVKESTEEKKEEPKSEEPPKEESKEESKVEEKKETTEEKKEETPKEEVKETTEEKKEEPKSEETLKEETKSEEAPKEEVKESTEEKKEEPKSEETPKEEPKEEPKVEEKKEEPKTEETPKEEPKVEETPKEEVKETTEEKKEETKSEEAPKEEVKETPKVEEKKEESTEEKKEEPKVEEAPKEEVKETTEEKKEETKSEEAPKEEVKETPKEEPKVEEKKEESTEAKKEEPKSEETPKEEVKETPKEEPKTEEAEIHEVEVMHIEPEESDDTETFATEEDTPSEEETFNVEDTESSSSTEETKNELEEFEI